MDKDAVLTLLDASGIAYELVLHEAVYHMGELTGVPHLERIAKNLLLRDDKKQHYYLLSVWGDKRLDLKAFRRTHHTRPLTFANDDDLERLLALAPGSVSPFGLLNDADARVPWFVDEEFFAGSGRIGVHPNDNTATLFLAVADIVALLRAKGHCVEVTTF